MNKIIEHIAWPIIAFAGFLLIVYLKLKKKKGL